MGVVQDLSLERKSLRYKLVIAFSLMSIIPLLIILYFVAEFIFPETENLLQVSAIVLFTLWISWLGYLLIRQIINPVIDLALETRIIAEGKYGTGVSMMREDELGDIAEAVNTMTGRIRSYIGELQEYSRKTAELNVQIHKKVITLTNLMRVGDLITSGTGFDELARFTAEKISGEVPESFSAVLIKEKMGNYSAKCFVNKSGKDVRIDRIESELSDLERLFGRNEYLAIDSAPFTKAWQKELKKNLGLVNAIFFPMTAGGRVIGAILLGNFTEGFEFDEDEIAVVRAFEKELALGFQSAQGVETARGAEIVDSLTGLYTRTYLEDRLEDEINRAVFYQRPCSLLVINVDSFEEYTSRNGTEKANQALKKIGNFLNTVMSPVGKVARFDSGEFGMLLPEKNKRESLEMAEQIRKKVESIHISKDPKDKVTVSIGVGENPIDGTNAREIIKKAYDNMALAKERGRNQVAGE
ncbi:MAG: diguanylate cyclase [Candidatus Omnitrophota bacterium]|jgi:diguanylate cyclase (GGDEF)-like protein